MAKHKKGDHVHTKEGKHGTVSEVHKGGTFYGIVGHAGVFPEAHVEADEPQNGTPSNPDPDMDGDNDIPMGAAAEHLAFVRSLRMTRGVNR